MVAAVTIEGDPNGKTTAKETSDAVVFFGATGDLGHKKDLSRSAAYDPERSLNVPVINVAKSGWTIEQLRDRARDSLGQQGNGADQGALRKLI